MAKTLLVNLPVDDLAKSVEFFSKLGFTPDPPNGQPSTRLAIGEGCAVVLHERVTFENYTNAPVADGGREVIVGVSVEERAEVDNLTDRAVAGGATDLGPAQDNGFLYMRGFRDLDGHQWSFLHIG